jgi:hypothetical protein
MGEPQIALGRGEINNFTKCKKKKEMVQFFLVEYIGIW